ncbi:capsule biosynthesis protein [Sinirhodobacter sp. HNIBRBA609]|nr:capsule biosynthesis protein [Sinirhodobacter sp. HNIBRBA609]
MTTNPKAEKYRIRRKAQPQAEATLPPGLQPGADPAKLFEPQDDGFGDMDIAPVKPAAAAPADVSPGDEIAAIEAEGLTGRQLRLARRTAQKHGIAAGSDFDAVRQLRRRGIDPFDRAGFMDRVLPGKPAEAKGDVVPSGGGRSLAKMVLGRMSVPSVAPKQPPPPSNEVLGEAQRARAIIRLQRDIARRRQRRLVLLAVRLAFFVLLPTLLAGWYYFRVATPLYATKSAFIIQKADGMGGGSRFGGLLSGVQLGSSQDSVTVQAYLQSRDAMLRLDEEFGFKAHFSQPSIDALQRLDPDATNEQAYKVYQRNVKIGYDPTEGIVNLEVIAADPDVSRQFSEALISFAEEQVDTLTSRLRDDQMKGALEGYADAEAKVLAAQEKVLTLQERVGILDPVSEAGRVMGQVATFEGQLQAKRLELDQLLDNPSPNQARVEGVKGDIDRLERRIVDLRAQLTETTGGVESLAVVTGQLRIAEAELQTRQLMLSTAAQQMEGARTEANKQVRYLEMGVRPVAPDEPTYPRAFENTLVAFLIFSGIYLMLSLTVAVLREQVSS